MSLAQTIQINIVSDVVCPWCFVGYRRLQKAMNSFTATHPNSKFLIRWMPFLLNPNASEEGVDKLAHYKSKFGPRIEQMLPSMVRTGEGEGIKFSFGGKIAKTLNSHRLLEWAWHDDASEATEESELPQGLEGDFKRAHRQDRLVQNLFSAYFEQEKNLGDRSTLLEAVAKSGLNVDKAEQVLSSDKYKSEVESMVSKWQDVGGVPYFIINKTFQVSGAQDPSTFLSIFNKTVKPSL